ncbi:MAG TPA: phosphate regulon sensor histidine kinase PhoR [Burkholderiaceae bacterium]|nr:phosphate regulon sensor histidine kinase PhoR [Burkholderiaceae bacterium]HNB42987.1 phosphate regulon sensor histidine kinase PhoR [Burkholderiaceae bacterium]
MDFIVGRTAWSLVLMALGAVAGHLVGLWTQQTHTWSAWIGAAVGVALAGLRDGRYGHRVMEWLRSGESTGAPRFRSAWGELAYRIERALVQRDKALAAEQRRLTDFLSAIEVSPNGVLLLDAEGHISWCNPVAADHFGLDPERDRGQRVTNLVRMPAFVELLQGPDRAEPVILSVYPAGISLTVATRAYGDGLRLVVSQDVTERQRSEAMRRDFVANVSHEIRTPLTVLAGFVETMASLPLTEPERQRVLGLMTQQTRRMQSLVADLLTLAQLEGSPRPTADHWVPLSELLAQVESEVRGLSKGRHELAFPQADAIAAIQLGGSQGELLSAMTNLASNAVRYTPEGGRISVTWALRPNGEGVYEVRDSGIGIAREHLPRLTERFYRVDGSRSRETGGTGLGLSIVKHVAQRHGATLEIDSEPGRGSSFRLVFPAPRLHEGDS